MKIPEQPFVWITLFLFCLIPVATISFWSKTYIFSNFRSNFLILEQNFILSEILSKPSLLVHYFIFVWNVRPCLAFGTIPQTSLWLNKCFIKWSIRAHFRGIVPGNPREGEGGDGQHFIFSTCITRHFVFGETSKIQNVFDPIFVTGVQFHVFRN